MLGVTLLRRSSKGVELTPEGAVFLADCRRVLAAADRASRRVQAAARGETGTLRLVYTAASAYETVPALLSYMGEKYPGLKIDAREVFGSDVPDVVRDGACDVALAPMTTLPLEVVQQTIRREVLRLVVGEKHRLANRRSVELAALRDERFELWPRDMSPGFYDAIVGACRAAGFEPQADPHGAGSTVWGYIADGRGIGLMVSSLTERLPRDVKLLDLAPPRPMLAINAVWRRDNTAPAIKRFLESAKQLATEHHWS